MEVNLTQVGMSSKKYSEIDKIQNKARSILGVNYYKEQPPRNIFKISN